MTRNTILAGVAGLLAAFATASVADALPLAKSPAAPQGIVEQTGPRGGGHGHGHGFCGGGGPRFHGGGPRFGGGGHFHGPRGPRFYGPRFRGFYPYAYGYGFGAYPYHYFDDFDDDYTDCEPLRRRAQATGKRYWWNRYYACIDG